METIFENPTVKSALYVLLAVGIFSALIMIHEFGHYITARLCHVTVREFALGMGPQILSFVSKKSGIRYSIRLFLIGGYVSMDGEDSGSSNPNAFCNKNIWQRILIIVAGAGMNILLGFFAMFILTTSTVMATEGALLPTNVIAEFNENATSNQMGEYGLMEGDRVIAVNGVPVFTGYDLIYEITNSAYKPVDLIVVRDDYFYKLEDVKFPTSEESGVVFGSYDFKVYGKAPNIGNLCLYSVNRAFSTVKMIYDSIFDMLRGRYGADAVSGPVGTTQVIGQAAQAGGATLLYLIAVITINLGVFNLLPVPALDGGRLMFLIVELFRGKPINKNLEGYVNFIGILVLFLLMALISIKDIIGLFT
ncbi:MAG: site-2 protease family protein [Clostridia bacterium]|nr:site-2 protease family protein [Clostridia bacterium]